MLQSELQGKQQQDETEKVPDNYPYRLPPLSGRREYTRSNVGNQKKAPDMTAHCLPCNAHFSDEKEQFTSMFVCFEESYYKP